MKKIYILLFLSGFFFIAKATAVSKVLLTDSQFKAIALLQNKTFSKDSVDIQLNECWIKDTALSKIPFGDFLSIMHLVQPLNAQIYKDSSSIYEICKTIAKDLTDKIMTAMDTDEEIPLASQQRFIEKGQFFNNNLAYYFQNQIFDIFYNNNVIYGLQSPEYVKVLTPKAVYKLLKDIKKDEILTDEILFMVNNSKYKLKQF